MSDDREMQTEREGVAKERRGREIQTDRQTDKKETNNQTHNQTHEQTYTKSCIQANRQTCDRSGRLVVAREGFIQ